MCVLKSLNVNVWFASSLAALYNFDLNCFQQPYIYIDSSDSIICWSWNGKYIIYVILSRERKISVTKQRRRISKGGELASQKRRISLTKVVITELIAFIGCFVSCFTRGLGCNPFYRMWYALLGNLTYNLKAFCCLWTSQGHITGDKENSKLFVKSTHFITIWR